MYVSSTWCLLVLVTFSRAQDCEPGWFGPNCQYKSHCPNSDCDVDARCPNDSRCEKGWFGPGCQYVDLVATKNTSVETNPRTIVAHIIDGNDQTCLMTSLVQDIIVTLDGPFPVTWIRLYVSKPVVPPEFDISITDAGGNNHVLTCKSVTVTNHLLDIHCNQTTAAVQVKISGEGVRSLCSLYISGGRNVALKQPTSQSSTGDHDGVNLESRLAVDGDTNGFLRDTTKSCTRSKTGDENPTWEITFTPAKVIYHFILYNRSVKNLMYRLKGFTLTCFDLNGLELFAFKDLADTGRRSYSVPVECAIMPVSRVRIQAAPQSHFKNQKIESVLALCEVEIYGDSVCYPGTYGFECEHTCNCTGKDERCVVSTGRCYTGCTDHLCTDSCTKETTASSELPLFVGVGVGAGVAAMCLILFTVIFYQHRKKMRGKHPHEYDAVDPNGRSFHNYNVFFQPGSTNGVPRNSNTDPKTLNASDESGLYEKVENLSYVELN